MRKVTFHTAKRYLLPTGLLSVDFVHATARALTDVGRANNRACMKTEKI